MNKRIRPIVFREPSSGEIVTTGMTPERRRSPTRLAWIAGTLIALALVAGVVWMLM